MQKRSYLTIALFGLLLIAGIYYARLGGFNEMKKEVAQQPQLYFTGRQYYGLSSDDELQEMMGEVFGMVKEGGLQGTFSICYLGNPDQEEDSLKVWVGTTAMSKAIVIPEGFEAWEIPEGKVVRATINAYSVVAPNPNKVNGQLQELAQENNLELDSIYLERYPEAQEILNEIYVK